MYIHTKLIGHQCDVLTSFFNNKYGFHCTLMYDVRNILHPIGFPTNTNFKATVKDVIFLGENEDILAFELVSPELELFHSELLKIGYRHSFEDFMAHMSLEYDMHVKDKSKIKIAEMFIGSTLKFDGVYLSEIKDD